jgi:small basic protein
MTFLLSYVFNISIVYWEQYFALTIVILLDGIFGIIAGTKREGFKTFKSLKIFKSLFSWIVILTTIFIVEKAFPFAFWLSETFISPVIIFYLISALKNASSSGFIKAKLLNQIMEKIDQHKN